jgi:hypothetical protein
MLLKTLYIKPKTYDKWPDTEKGLCKWGSLGSLLLLVAHWLLSRGLTVGMGRYFFTLPWRPEQLWYRLSLVSLGSGTAMPITYLHLVSKLRMRGVMPPLSNVSYENTMCNSCIFILYEETIEAAPIKNNMFTRYEFLMLVISTTHSSVVVIAHLSVTVILPLL